MSFGDSERIGASEMEIRRVHSDVNHRAKGLDLKQQFRGMDCG